MSAIVRPGCDGRDEMEPNGRRRGASAGDGRRAGEEGRMPVADGGAFFASRSRGAELDEDDESCGEGYWRHRMEDDAEGAVVGVRLERMDVRYLDGGKESQQD
jgi:hypothetical protein